MRVLLSNFMLPAAINKFTISVKYHEQNMFSKKTRGEQLIRKLSSLDLL